MTGTLFPCAAGMGALQDGGRSAGRPLCIRRRRKEVEMEQSINVLLVEPGKIPCLRETANSMEAVEEVLGGVSQLGCLQDGGESRDSGQTGTDIQCGQESRGGQESRELVDIEKDQVKEEGEGNEAENE